MCTCVCDEATVYAVSSSVVYKYLAEFQFASPFRIGREIRTFAFPTPKPLVKTTMTCFISECAASYRTKTYKGTIMTREDARLLTHTIVLVTFYFWILIFPWYLCFNVACGCCFIHGYRYFFDVSFTDVYLPISVAYRWCSLYRC